MCVYYHAVFYPLPPSVLFPWDVFEGNETIRQTSSDGDNQIAPMKICRFGMYRCTSFTVYFCTESIVSASLVMLIMVLTLRIPGMLFIGPTSKECR